MDIINFPRQGILPQWGFYGPTAKLRRVIAALFSQGQQGVMYVPQPQVLGQQVLYQDSAGTTPVTADGQPVGLMLDLRKNPKPRKNFLTYTERFDVSSWQKTRLTVASDAGTAADGSLTADKLIPSTDNATHFIFQNTPVFSETVTVSMQVKPAGYDYVSIFLNGGTAETATFNISTGVVVSSVGSTNPKIRELTDGWYEIDVEFIDVGSNTPYILPSATGDVSFPGDGTSGILITKAQVEKGVEPTAYQKIETGIGGEWTPGNHATQITASRKPVYKASAGKEWIGSDGVDDSEKVPWYQGSLADQTISLAFEEITPRGFGYIFGAPADGGVGLIVNNGFLRPYITTTAGTNSFSSLSISGAGPVVVTVQWSSVNQTLTLFVDGVEVNSITSTGSELVTGTEHYFFGKTETTQNYAAKLFGGVCVSGNVQEGQRVYIEKYLASLAGVTL